MNLTKQDIESVAKARVGRTEGNRTMYWLIGSAIAIVGGAYLTRMPNMNIAGWVISILGVIALLYYTRSLSMKQNVEKFKLLKEWEKEQQEKAVPNK